MREKLLNRLKPPNTVGYWARKQGEENEGNQALKENKEDTRVRNLVGFEGRKTIRLE